MPTMTSIEPSYTGTRECKCSRSAGRISAAGVSTSRQTMSGRGTMTDRTRVSSSSNTLWIISRSSRSTTPSLAPTCLSRARPREKYAASAPVRIAEQTMRMPRASNPRPRVSDTGAARHEMLEPGADRDGLPAGVDVPDAVGGGRHLAHRAEPCPDRRREPPGQALERLWRAGEEELVVLAAAGGPRQRLPIERPRYGMHRGLHGEPSELHARTEPALLTQVAEIGREAVG